MVEKYWTYCNIWNMLCVWCIVYGVWCMVYACMRVRGEQHWQMQAIQGGYCNGCWQIVLLEKKR